MPEPTVHELAAADADEAAAVLAAAFRNYPTTAWFFDGDAVAREDALAALVRFFVAARLVRGEPVLGVRRDGRLAAVALVSDPAGGASPPELALERDALWARVGQAARRRYEAYGAAVAPLLEDPAGLHVNLVGVHPSGRGRGLARRLFDHVHALAATISNGRGVSLTTEDPANVALYRHLGYEVAGSVDVAPGITSWAMRRPVDPLDLARALAWRLDGLPWAIGGSVLLRDLGMEVRPRDLDLVTTVERFDAVSERLAAVLGSGERPPHDTLRSVGFVRFGHGPGPAVDLMAGVRSHVGGDAFEWHLDPATIERRGGLPWASGADWLEVYDVLGRLERAEQLRRHLLEGR